MVKIILGDDDVAFAGAVSAVLSEGDHDAVTVTRAVPDLLSAVGSASPALCVLDRRFDDRDVLDLLVELRRRSPSTKVVVLTADADRDGPRQALDRGADGFVHKTRGMSALLGAVERVLAGATVVEEPPRWRGSRSGLADHRPSPGFPSTTR